MWAWKALFILLGFSTATAVRFQNVQTNKCLTAVPDIVDGTLIGMTVTTSRCDMKNDGQEWILTKFYEDSTKSLVSMKYKGKCINGSDGYLVTCLKIITSYRVALLGNMRLGYHQSNMDICLDDRKVGFSMIVCEKPVSVTQKWKMMT